MRQNVADGTIGGLRQFGQRAEREVRTPAALDDKPDNLQPREAVFGIGLKEAPPPTHSRR